MIDVKCDACGRRFRVPPELAGQHGRCVCGADVPIPALETPPTPVPTVPAGNREQTQRLRSVPLWLLAGLVGLLSSLICLPLMPALQLPCWWPRPPALPWLVWLLFPLLGILVAVIVHHRRFDVRALIAGTLAGLGVSALLYALPLACFALRWKLSVAWHWAGVWVFMGVVSTLVSSLVTTWCQQHLADAPVEVAGPMGLLWNAGRLAATRSDARWLVATAWTLAGGLLFGLEKALPLLKAARTVPSLQNNFSHVQSTIVTIALGWALAAVVSGVAGLGVTLAESRCRSGAAVAAPGFIALVAGLLIAADLFRPGPAWILAIAFLPAVAVAGVVAASRLFVAERQPDERKTRITAPLVLAVLTAALLVVLVPQLRINALVGYVRTGTMGQAALARLAQCRDPRAVPELIHLLDDPNQHVIKAALTALSGVGQPAVKPLLQALTSANPAVRGGAAVALGKIGDRQAVKPLIAAISDARDVAASARLWRPPSFLFRLPWLGSRLAHSSLIAHAPSRTRADPQTAQELAAIALGRLHDAAAFSCLANLLTSTEPPLRRAGATALGELGDRRAVPLLIASLSDNDMAVRCCSATALGQLGDRRAGQPLIALLGRGSDEDDQAALAALLALHQDVHGALKNVLYHNDDVTLKWWAATALGRIGDAEAVRMLTEALRRPQLQASASAGLNAALKGPDGAEAQAVLKQWSTSRVRDNP